MEKGRGDGQEGEDKSDKGPEQGGASRFASVRE